MSDQSTTRGAGAVKDVGDSFDPFRASHPAVLVHDVGAREFEDAWQGRCPCPICRQGTAAERGEAACDSRAWVRFSCGDVVALEQTAG